MMLSYAFGVAFILLLIVSRLLWNFRLVLILQSVSAGGSIVIGNAWVTDLTPRSALGKALALFAATGWIVGVIGFGVVCFMLQNVGFIVTCLVGAALGLAGIGLVVPIRRGRQAYR
jgi:MFS family permease